MSKEELDPTHGTRTMHEATQACSAGQDGEAVPPALRFFDDPDLTNTELVQLRMRVIALENLMIAMLANASEQQMNLARNMAEYILPREGATAHPLTIHAAAQMRHLVERARLFQRGAMDDATECLPPEK